jgi:hypothetical protein
LGDGVGKISREDFFLRFQSSPRTEMGGTVWGGVFWRKLEEGYLLSRPDRRKGQVLIDTGRTMKSFTDDAAPGNVSNFDAADGSFTMEFGSDLEHVSNLQETWPIAAWHPLLLEKVSDFVLQYLASGNSDFKGFS